ncbi:ClpX C4-type zinc finger [Rhizobiales bacterium GAS191]|nr:ClpX C4-type zinc finger [Rhizobiales bacterium GAS191]
MKSKLACSFCGLPDSEVKRLIAGPKVFICDACIGACNEILARHPPKDGASAERTRPSQQRRWPRFLPWGKADRIRISPAAVPP